jgi:hypothetical protein
MWVVIHAICFLNSPKAEVTVFSNATRIVTKISGILVLLNPLYKRRKNNE